ncbi:inosine guanosine and xanthosine phosphorylase family protein [Russula earlei]|uniref:Inosine guanosine and xanthosine phosphorylase family protein n=1 Tax=Russula earlei TaxID=71964 RepID=A0ACC0U0B1_9AGAM|nr:inosine guanosine and xanthosine phosphorylase family protein [Russula earlei]
MMSLIPNNSSPSQLPFNIAKLAELLPTHLRNPQVGIVCGSGLGTLAESITERVTVPYRTLEGFGESTVLGHRSELAFGKIGDVSVVAMLGRFHAYEGFPLATVVYPIRFMAALGVQDLIITNAAGSLKADVPVGTIVVVEDHIALPLLTGFNPLLGPISRPAASRFVPLSDAYARPLRLAAFRAAHVLGLPRSALAEGTYAWVSGPTYETRGEAALLAAAGASVVGMSTVPEVVAARDEGIRVLVLSLVTNMVVGVLPGTGGKSVRQELDAELEGKALERPPTPTVSHEEVLEVGKSNAAVMRRLVERIIISIG